MIPLHIYLEVGLALKFLKLRIPGMLQFAFVFGLKLFETNKWFQKIYFWLEFARSLISREYALSSLDSTVLVLNET